MPTVNRYQQQTGVSGAGSGVAMPRRGNIADLAATGAKVLERAQQRDDANAVAEAMANLRLTTTQKYLDAQGKAADDAADFTPGVLRDFDADVTELKNTAKNRRAREAIHAASLNLRDELGQRAMQFQASRLAESRVTRMKGAIDSMSAALALDPDQFGEAIAEQSAAIEAMQFEPVQRQQLREYLATKGFEAAAIGVAKRDPAAALERLKSTKSGDPRFDGLSLEQRDRVEQRALGQLAQHTSSKILEAYRVDVRQGTKALAALAESNLPADVLAEVRSQVRTGVGLIRAERREEHGEQVTALELAITQGRPGVKAEGQAAALYRRGAYSAEQYTNVLQAIDEARQRGAKHAAGVALIADALATGKRLDPRDTDVVKDVDSWFKEQTQANNLLPGTSDWINGAAAVASRTNILPPEATGWARKALLSADPRLAVPAANALARWSEASPAAFAYFDDPNIKAFAEQLDGLIRAGTTPAKATEIAHANVYLQSKEQRDRLELAYRNGKYAQTGDASNASNLKSRMDADDSFDRALFAGAPAPSAVAGSGARAMADEYELLVRNYYQRMNGDIVGARDLAWKDLRGTYGYSTVNGEPEVLKYAPELVFPGIDVGVIRSDAADAARALGYTGAIRLVPSRLTGDSGGILWELHTTDADGHDEVILDQRNRPLVYSIPTDTARYVEAQNNAKRAAIDEARAESARRRATIEAMEAYDPLKNDLLQ